MEPARSDSSRSRRPRSTPTTWVRTTDLARIDAEGFVWIVGRADQAIVRGGFKIHPDDVRAALERHPRVRAASVVGRDDRRLGAVPVAAVELRPGEGPVTPEALVAHLSGLLARYEVPTEIRILDALPRTESGKVDLASVRELFDNSESASGLRPGDGGLTMDLRPSAADETFRAEIRQWLQDAVPRHGPPPQAGGWPARRDYDTSWQRKLHDAGYSGLAWSASDGGRGLPVSQQIVYYEECARAAAPAVGVNFVGLMHAGPTLIAEGTDEQRAAHLPRILNGESVWCQGFSEPDAGSDLASLRTRAERRGNEYVVTGQKIWSTRAHVADWCELLVRTDPDAPKHRGITWLILEMDQPGVEVRPMRTIDGDDHFCELFLDGARVPVANRVGGEHDGWRVANVTLRFERGTAFAQHIISMRSQLRRLVALAVSRPWLSGTAWDDTALRRAIGRLEAHVDALWRMTQMCATEAEYTGAAVSTGFGDQAALQRAGPGDRRAGREDRRPARRGPGRLRRHPDLRGGPPAPELPAVHDRGGNLADPTQPRRRAHPRHAEGMTVRWTFGEEPLRQTTAAAGLLRRITGLVVSMEHDDPAVDRLSPRFGKRSGSWPPSSPPTRSLGSAPRSHPTAGCTSIIRVTSAATTPVSPSTRSQWTAIGPRALSSSPRRTRDHPGSSTAASFPCYSTVRSSTTTAISALPGRRHRCRSASAARRRCSPSCDSRWQRRVDGGRIASTAQLMHDDTLLAEAEVRAIAGERANLPEVSPRRPRP